MHFSSLIPKMLMFILANLLPDHVQFNFVHGPNIPGSYAILFFAASNLLSSPDTSTTECCFCFRPATSFLLRLVFVLHSSPVAHWAPTHLGSSSFSVISFCLFILFMGFSRQEYWSGLPFPSPEDHVLSELSTMTRLSWVALHGMVHSLIELDKAVVLVISWANLTIAQSPLLSTCTKGLEPGTGQSFQTPVYRFERW